MKLLPCPSCGRNISQEANSCPKCGQPLGEAWTEKVEADIKARANKVARGVAIGMLILLGFVIYSKVYPDPYSEYAQTLEKECYYKSLRSDRSLDDDLFNACMNLARRYVEGRKIIDKEAKAKAKAKEEVLESEASAKTPETITLASQDYGADWPFTVPKIELGCENLLKGSTIRPHVYAIAGDKKYGLNGAAMGNGAHYINGREITKKEDGVWMNTSDFIKRGLDLCGSS